MLLIHLGNTHEATFGVGLQPSWNLKGRFRRCILLEGSNLVAVDMKLQRLKTNKCQTCRQELTQRGKIWDFRWIVRR